ncbi:MAG: C25 family cysteine peptidase [Chitinophagaceae bacterium]
MMSHFFLSHIRKLILACCLFATAYSHAQLNNEWIDYTKTYYKFRVGKNGLVRISQPTLAANSLSAIPAQNFQLWRNGVQVAVYTTIATGVLGNNDYIEFYGVMNDGKADRTLYRDPNYQLNGRVSLQTDSSTYFLTYNTIGGNARIASAANNVAGNVLPAEPFFTYTDKFDFKEQVSRGYASPVPEYIYSSSYDIGEMLSSFEIYTDSLARCCGYIAPTYPRNFYPYTAGNGTCTMKLAMAGVAPNSRNVNITLGNKLMGQMTLNAFEAKSQTYINIPVTNLPTGQSLYAINNTCQTPYDRVVVNYIDLTYPRLFKFNSQRSFEFELAASAAGKYIEITDFDRGTALPVLYDLTNNRRYLADVSGATIRFALPASSALTSYVLLSQDNSHVIAVGAMAQKSFINYAVTANQGDYLIISNSILYAPVAGSNPVDLYRQYRASAVGGGYNAKVYDIDQLEDQFAYGIKKHPSSIRNFLRYARQQFSVQPKYAFLIGKGVSYQDYRFGQSLPIADKLNLVPTFGYPGSDVLLSSADISPYPTTPIGRISVVDGNEIMAYLNKVKEYEIAQVSPSQTQADKAWMKNVVHVVGANSPDLDQLLSYYFSNYKRIIQDTMYGGNVTTLSKFNSGTATNIGSEVLGHLFTDGIGLLTYFGHSSATALDYNLEDPNTYSNPKKYPLFLLNGCNAGNFFTLDTSRFMVKSTISEKYVLAPNRGSIGLIASTHFGLTGGLDAYSTGLYNSFAKIGYGKSVGKNVQDAIQYITNTYGPGDYSGRIHSEEQTLHGDPAVMLIHFAKPDYSIEEPNIVINPNFISVAEDSFSVKVYHYNLGKATGDSITVEVKRQYPVSAVNPSGLTELVYSKKILSPKYNDSINFRLPIVGNRDKGPNRITVTMDTENKVDELSEFNNTASKDFVIFEDEMRPVYPYNFAISNKQGIKVIGSTSNPFADAKAYRMEMDTTELFNSPFKITRNTTVPGGIAEFDPGITYTDSTVYYWRLAVVPANNAPIHWNTSSFVYLAGTSLGFNQSHVYQQLKSGASRVYIDSFTRIWNYTPRNNNLFFTQSVYPVSGDEDGHFSISVNNELRIVSACAGHSLLFSVFDPITFAIMSNTTGRYGSVLNNCAPGRNYNFEWDDRTPANRKLMMDFMDSIPNGSYVAVRKILDAPYENETFAAKMKADEAIFGAGKSLYHKFKSVGFADIDSFYKPRVFVLLYKKGDPTFEPKWKFSDGLERIQMNAYAPTPDTLGYITSPVVGPSRSWKNVKWRGKSQDAQAGDYATVDVIGVNLQGTETKLYTLTPAQQDFDISAVSATQYPYMRLRMRNADSVNGTAYNLRYWRLLYDPAPEGALAANILLKMKDTLETGEPLDFAIAFKNTSDVKFRDSIKVNVVVQDQANVKHFIQVAKKKDLVPGDTTTIKVSLDSKDYPGVNNIFLDVNPADDQPEQYHFNNFLYRNFYVKSDNYNPLLDVTFDGIHILNRDIVSSKPHIQVQLKDESKFLALNDTSLLVLTLRFPDGTTRSYRFGTDTLRFTPGVATGDNTATIDFYPTLDQDTDQRDYEMVITGKDRSGNRAGPSEFRISFQVFNKPMISNLFNYPNPFTTSTAFVFTITGHEIPQEFKIQILTITGKIVREVTKPELGTLNIGRNITEFKWDGTDQYGAKLANGVYLYRVVTGLNGKKMEQFRINDNFNQQSQDQTDKYFNKGYGKMYLMR